MITTEHVIAYEKSDRVKEARSMLSTSDDRTINKEQHALVRNYLIVQLALSNACRTSGIIALTTTQFNDAVIQDDNYVVKVRMSPIIIYVIYFA